MKHRWYLSFNCRVFWPCCLHRTLVLEVKSEVKKIKASSLIIQWIHQVFKRTVNILQSKVYYFWSSTTWTPLVVNILIIVHCFCCCCRLFLFLYYSWLLLSHTHTRVHAHTQTHTHMHAHTHTHTPCTPHTHTSDTYSIICTCIQVDKQRTMPAWFVTTSLLPWWQNMLQHVPPSMEGRAAYHANAVFLFPYNYKGCDSARETTHPGWGFPSFCLGVGLLCLVWIQSCGPAAPEKSSHWHSEGWWAFGSIIFYHWNEI